MAGAAIPYARFVAWQGFTPEKIAGVELALPWSSAAKRLVHDLIGPRRIDVAAEPRLILVRHGKHRQQTLEGREIPIVHGCGDRLLHQMVARNDSRVSRAHRRLTLVRLSTLLCKPMAPPRRPIVEGARIGKQATHTRVPVEACSSVAQPAEDQGEIGAVAGHALEEVLC